MGTEPTGQLTSCPKCGHCFDPIIPPPVRRARMVWSNRMARYVRKHLTAIEERVYEKNGSID